MLSMRLIAFLYFYFHFNWVCLFSLLSFSTFRSILSCCHLCSIAQDSINQLFIPVLSLITENNTEIPNGVTNHKHLRSYLSKSIKTIIITIIMTSSLPRVGGSSALYSGGVCVECVEWGTLWWRAHTFHGPLEEHLAAAAGHHTIVAARGLVRAHQACLVGRAHWLHRTTSLYCSGGWAVRETHREEERCLFITLFHYLVFFMLLLQQHFLAILFMFIMFDFERPLLNHCIGNLTKKDLNGQTNK